MHLLRITLAIFLFVSSVSYAQTTLYDTIQHDNLDRDYILYIPQIYDGSEPVPLVLNLHGYTSNANEQLIYSNFSPIADTANFIMALPNGTKDNAQKQFWEVGLFGGQSGIDDFGFIEKLVDTMIARYNIDPDRVYSTGMSNGGYMSYSLACGSNKFASIASVTGSMTPFTMNTCSPVSPAISVMQVHGTMDATVQYNGNQTTVNIDSLIAYWVNFNNCDPQPQKINIPDTAPGDGSTAEHYIYRNGNNESSVEFFKVIGGGHTWPGASIIIGSTNQDFNASAEIWRFFNKREPKIYTYIDQKRTDKEITIYPNPGIGFINIKSDFESESRIDIYDIMGSLKQSQHFKGNTNIDVSMLNSGTYLIVINNNGNKYFERIVLK